MKKFLTALGIFVWVLSSGCDESAKVSNSPVKLNALEKRAIRIINESLDSRNDIMRTQAIEVVATTGRKDLMPKVIRLLNDDSIAVQFAAALAIGDTRYRQGELAVKSLLQKRDKNARIAGSYALVKLGQSNYADIIRAATRSKDQTVRANAALLLGKIGDRRDLDLLYQVLRDKESEEMARFQAVESLAMLGDVNVYKNKLWPLLISKYPDDKIIGIRGMAALNTSDARNAIMTMLDDEILEVRLFAAEQLGVTGNRSGEEEVLKYFRNEPHDPEDQPEITRKAYNPDDRSVANRIAALAIGRIGGERLKSFLPDLLTSRSKEVRLNAAQSALLLGEN